jgi:hypothetical protein
MPDVEQIVANKISLERFADTVCPNLIDILRKVEPIHLLQLKISGPKDLFGLYLRSDTKTWIEHPAIAQIASGATTRGAEWVTGSTVSKPVSVRQRDGSLIAGGYDGAYPLVRNNAAPTPTQTLLFHIVGKLGYNHAWCRARLQASKAGDGSYLSDAVDYTHADWLLLDTFLRGFAKKLGFSPLSDVPSRCVHPSVVATDSFKFRLDDIVRCGVKYMQFEVSDKDNATTRVMVMIPLAEDESNIFPVIHFSSIIDGGGIGYLEFLNPIYSTSSWHRGFSADRYLDVPPAYKTDVFGTTYTEADIPTGYASDTELPLDLKAALVGVNRIRLLPLLAPLGNASYFFRVPTESVTTSEETHEVTIVDQATGLDIIVPVKITSVTGIAQDVLTAIPTDWYHDYMSSGFGYFKGLGSEAAGKAIEAMASLQSYVHTAVFSRDPVVVPQELVAKLDIYLAYKKAREKACLGNDFMQLEYDSGITWGSANALCNRAGSVNVVYGITDVNPSAGYAFTDPSYAGSVMIMVDTTILPYEANIWIDGLDTGMVLEEDRAEVFRYLKYGAGIQGTSATNLASNWGFDYALITETQTEGTVVATELRGMTNPIWRGRGEASGDFSWENTGISGYPVVRELALQDGYKALIYSIVMVKGRTDALHQAFLGFGSKAYVGDMF